MAAPPASEGPLNSAEALPVVVEEVTAAWLTKVLGCPVREATLVEPIHGTASKLLYKIEYSDAKDAASHPAHVCVKGGFNPALVKLHPALNAVYRREAEFFHYIAPKLSSMRLPHAWYAGSDTVTGQGIVVLDDLKKSGHSFGTPLEAWPVARVHAGVEELAALHAGTWGAKPEDFPWLKEGLSLREVILSMTVESEWAKRYFDPAARPPVPDHMTDRERMIRAFKTMWATTNPAHMCITHGDAHIGNTFISAAGEPGFLDWQGLHSNSFLHDVTYFVAGTLTIQDRRDHEVAILDHYLTSLHAAGGPKLERADIWDEYRKHHLHGFAWSTTPPTMQPKDLVDVMSARHVAAIVDHQSLELLESLPEYVKE